MLDVVFVDEGGEGCLYVFRVVEDIYEDTEKCFLSGVVGGHGWAVGYA